jgi:alpha-methylacyl-CoA racemase
MGQTLPLDGVEILDLTRLLPGGYATMVLHDLGASVTKIENPDGGDELRGMPPFCDGVSVLFSAINRGKKSVAVNLKLDEGRQVFLKLARQADVIVEGFRPGVTARLGVDYESVRGVKADIVYCSITGYGQDGPYRDKAGHDLNYLGYAGVASLTGTADGTLSVPGVQIADIGCGALMAVIGILAAVHRRDTTGDGAYLDVSMFDGALAWVPFQLAEYFSTGDVPGPGIWTLSGKYPCYNLYRTRDGGYLAVGALEMKFWANLCRELGRPDLLEGQFATGDDGDAVKNELAAIFATKTRDEWVARLGEKDVCVGPVNALDEAVRDPHVRHRGIIDRPDGAPVPYVRFPVKLEGVVPTSFRPAPVLGEDTDETLSSLGYSEAELHELAASGAIRRATPQ